jgi:hypothetical protein
MVEAQERERNRDREWWKILQKNLNFANA